MANVQRITGDVQITGSLTVTGEISGQSRSGMSTDTDQVYPLHIQGWRIWDAFQTVLTTAGTDDLGVTTGTFGTGTPYLTAGDLKAAGATSRRARTLFQLPPEYVTGSGVTIRFAAGMITTVSDGTATVDVEAWKSDRDTTIGGSDLVSTAATTINSLTFGNKDFDLNSGSLAAGDWLDIRVTIAVSDAATATAVIGAIAHAEIIFDIKG